MKRNPLDTRGMACDFCGKGAITKIHTLGRAIFIGSIPRIQFAGCAACSDLIAKNDVNTLIKNAVKLTPLQGRMKAKIGFTKIFTGFFINLIDSQNITPTYIYEFQLFRAAAKREKCELKLNHPKLGSCLELASMEVEAKGTWRKTCICCAATTLNVDEIDDVIGHPQARTL